MTYARTTRTRPAHTPEPFWQRLRPIMLYPVHGAALYTLIALTLFSLLTFIPGIGTMMRGLLWLTAYKYGFEILRATADGRPESPEGPLSFDNGVVWRLIGLQVLAVVAVLGVLAAFGPGAALFALAAVAFLQPGCIMSLAMDGSLRRALNPAVSFGVVARIGWPYLAVVGLLFVIQASAGSASELLGGRMPPVIGDLVITFLSLWALFATFHLMGYLVFQYHDALGYSPEALHDALPDLHRPDAALLEEAESLVRDGHTLAAIERLRGELRVRAISVDAHELLHRLLRQSGDAAAVSEHGATYLNLLLLERREREAQTLLRTLIDLDRDFVPLQTAHVVLLASRARDAGQSQLAADVFDAALRRHGRDADAPHWGLDLGMLLLDRLGRDADARAVLEQARERCEDDALRARIDTALQLARALPA
ncbi:hypothetical protein [Cognatilysobacter bugurensis]|uniref:Tetratricopeptide repeat protein n=1 Tax=Cognatilysobacter bugurensis TaxID=543356 RepID=A0A918STJ4_9GAMM|nr:hypothetical protein [Lysobacter bugurensis]GHA70957.1 hypothetical protein GCM10007067_04010 [Lysobacter bugurensis]